MIEYRYNRSISARNPQMLDSGNQRFATSVLVVAEAKDENWNGAIRTTGAWELPARCIQR